MDKLFNHPGFRLIYVDDNGSMSLEGPFQDEESRKKVQEYRCISHVWGTGDGKDHVWKDHGVGVDWKVEVRQEKRERVLQVFNHHKGYFWMDVFCTNQDDNKPLDVMGDIYKNCVECVCLLDSVCDMNEFTCEKDVLADMSENVKRCIKREHDTSKRDKLVAYNGLILQQRQISYLDTMRNGNWHKRVWTLQESVLPQKLLFCSEQAKPHIYSPFDHEFLRKIFSHETLELAAIDRYDSDAHDRIEKMGINACFGTDIYRVLICISYMMRLGRKYHNIWDSISAVSISERTCTNKEDLVYGVLGILNVSIPNGLELDDAIIKLDEELQKQGIFMRHDMKFCQARDINTLSALYDNKKIMDGVRLLGKVDKSKFSSDICIIESIGTVFGISPENKCNDDYFCEQTGTVSYEPYIHPRHYINGSLITTMVGRKDCTFPGRRNPSDEIFEIKGSKVEVVYVFIQSFDEF